MNHTLSNSSDPDCTICGVTGRALLDPCHGPVPTVVDGPRLFARPKPDPDDVVISIMVQVNRDLDAVYGMLQEQLRQIDRQIADLHQMRLVTLEQIEKAKDLIRKSGRTP